MKFARLLMLLLPAVLISQDLSGLTFCIDPGHGLGNGNAGPTGLLELEINMDVANYLRSYLTKANADTVIMTRYDNHTNPSLSQRENIANNFGVSWFHSVHHNAYQSTARFTLMLMEEERDWSQRCPNGGNWGVGTGIAEWPGQTDALSHLMGATVFEALRTAYWTSWLDWSFYGGCNGGFSLGVLNNLQMPGQLSEATFHDHPAEERKLRSQAFLQAEALGLYRGFQQFFGAAAPAGGVLAGIVKSSVDNSNLNGAKILVLPDSMQFTTDNWNNGIYYIFDIPPGDYTVQFSAVAHDTVQQQITISADSITFEDVMLTGNLAPTIVSSDPANGDEGIDVSQNIRIDFSKPMDTGSVEQAFRITPDFGGNIQWQNSNKRLIYSPLFPLLFDTTYSVGIAATAQDASSYFLDGNGDGIAGDDFLMHFHTAALDTGAPFLLDRHPENLSLNNSLQTIISMQFNKPLDPATVVPENFYFVSVRGDEIGGSLRYATQKNRSAVMFIPDQPLQPGLLYFANAGAYIADRAGNSLGTNQQWRFATDFADRQYEVLDNFARISGEWQDSILTYGNLTIAHRPAVRDSVCAHISYFFPDSGGQIRLLRVITADTINVLTEGDELTLAIFGNLSFNRIRLLFSDGGNLYFTAPFYDNRLGWFMFRHLSGIDPLYDSLGVLQEPTALLCFAGLQVEHTGDRNGVLSIDYLALGSAVTGIQGKTTETPHEFLLRKNYPNPFNPQTTIEFFLPRKQAVTGYIYNAAGQIVERLAEKDIMPSGWQRFIWNAGNHSSGVYVLSLKAGGKTMYQKLVLLK